MYDASFARNVNNETCIYILHIVFDRFTTEIVQANWDQHEFIIW